MTQLKRLKEFYHVFDAIQHGVAVFDTNGKVIAFNKAAGNFFNKNPELVIGEFIGDIFPAAWKDIKTIIKTGKSQIGKRINLEGYEIIANRTPIKTDKNEIIGVISIFQDISAYEKALTDLESHKELNEILDAIIESSFDGIWVCNNEGRVIRVNSASAKMDGLTTKHFIGRKMQDLVKEGFIDKSVTLEVLKKKTTVTLIQNTQIGKQILVTGNPVFDKKGKLRLVVVNERDYTVLNQLQKELEESRALAREYRSELSQRHGCEEIMKKFVIRSKNMERVFNQAVKVSKFDSNALIQGESGVGKSQLCKIIHQLSNRKDGPFIRVDCGAIPESLIESELFGYEKGAFTGAEKKGKPGLFELADTGTLFLDEVGELPLHIQVKLLRFLEEGELIRVGGTETKKINVRILAATNRNLEDMAKQGGFRKDLYFRLNVVPLFVPPLSERTVDIPALIKHFMEKFNKKCRTTKTLSPKTVDCLCNYDFPGNIRELANLIEQLIVLTAHNQIEQDDLPAHIRINQKDDALNLKNNKGLKSAIQQFEKNMIAYALDTHVTQVETAKRLCIDQATLSRKIKQYRLKNISKLHTF